MTEHKYTYEEVIRALEWCCQSESCEYCQYREKTNKDDICPIKSDALDLINRQKAEIERLKEMLDATIAGQETLQTAYLNARSDTVDAVTAIINNRIDNIRARIPYGGRAQGKTLAVEKMRLLGSLKVEIAKKYTEETDEQ